MQKVKSNSPHWITKKNFPKYLLKYLQLNSIEIPEKLIWSPSNRNYDGRTWFYIPSLLKNIYADQIK